MAQTSISVLFVTSDPVLAAVYRLKLELDEYSLTWSVPRKALDDIRATKPDLVYLDVDSEGGDELLRRMLASGAFRVRPLILITRRPEEIEALLPDPVGPIHVIPLARPREAALIG